MTREALRVGIVGAGIAGLTAAIALRRLGHEPSVFERAAALRNAGGALLLWPRAIKRLGQLGLADELRDLATPLLAHEFRTWQGEVIVTLPLAALEARHGSACMLVQRAELLELLAHGLPSEHVHYGKRAARITQLESEVAVEFADHSHARFDVLVGADGIHSTIRPYVHDDLDIRPTRRRAWAGIADGLHPLADCGVAVTLVGPGVMFLYAGLKNAATYWYATLSDETEGDLEVLRNSLSDRQEPALELIDATPAPAMFTTMLRDRAPTRPWSRGRVVLTGDAIHPCAPDLGQGACQAIESAYCLAEQLDHASSLELGLHAYEEQRFRRCALLTVASHGSLIQTLLEDQRIGPNWPRIARWTAPPTMLPVLNWLAGPDSE